MWKLAEVLVGEKQQCQDAKSQQKEQMVLLEKKSATYSQVCQALGRPRLSLILAPGPLLGKPRSFDLPGFLLILGFASPASRGSGASALPCPAAEASSGAPA